MPSQHGLTFSALRSANIRRLGLFTNRHGVSAHSEPDGSDWSPNDWMVATMGELGEAANVMKKIRRGDYTPDEKLGELAQEFSDVVIYLDLLAFQYGIDLGEAVKQTWNAKSRQIGIQLELFDTYYVKGGA